MAISLRSSRPAQSDVAIVLCTDARFLVPATAVAHQLATSGATENIDIVLTVTENCHIPPSLDFLNLRICHLDTADLFEGLYIGERHTVAAYHRLALPEAFSSDYKRILYLDGDVFFHGGDLAAFLRQDMQGYTLAAVLDEPMWFDTDIHYEPLKTCGLGYGRYFNSGVLLIDVASFVERNILNRCIQFGLENRHRVTQHDQQLLNCVLHRDWLELDRTWQHVARDDVYQRDNPVKFTHFTGLLKPWSDHKHRLPAHFKRPLRAFVRTHFPDYSERQTLERWRRYKDWRRLLRGRTRLEAKAKLEKIRAMLATQ